MYFDDLVLQMGLVKEKEESVDTLKAWGVIKEEYVLEDVLDYKTLSLTLERMMDHAFMGDALTKMKERGWILETIQEDMEVSKEEAYRLIALVKEKINAVEFDTQFDFSTFEEYREDETAHLEKDKLYSAHSYQKGDILLLKDGFYRIEEVREGYYESVALSFEEVMETMKLSGSYLVDFDDVIIEEHGEVIEPTLYHKKDFKSLASTGTRELNVGGFRVSYSLSTSGIKVHVSKKSDAGLNVYGDFELFRLRPSFAWDYEKGNIKHAYFKVDFQTKEALGVSTGKYLDYYLSFKDLDHSSFLNMVQSTLHSKKDALEATIPICTIKTPIPSIPFVYLNLDLNLHIYVSGKVELSIGDRYNIGFEVRNNRFRTIFDQKHDMDAILQASTNASLGLNLHLDALNYRLMDIDTKAGARAYVKAVLHLFDETGEMESVESDEVYAALYEVSKENANVALCGDVSLHWLLDVGLNTSKTLLHHLGLSKTFHILDDDNQIFQNMSHIENGHFVKSCTRKKRNVLPTLAPITSDKILLERYSVVLKVNETSAIPVKAIPKGYAKEDLVFESEKDEIVSVLNGKVTAKKPGSAKIRIFTKDQKHEVSYHILVSDG